MNQQSLTLTTRDQFMAFFRNSNSISMLSNDDKAEIAAQILGEDAVINHQLLQEVLSEYNLTVHQIIKDQNSAPIF
jgi:hypothetical protein